MKALIILLFAVLIFCPVRSFSTPNYVTVTDECPVVTFTEANISKICVYKKYVKVQLTPLYVYVNITNGGNQIFSWNAAQATAYGGRTLTELYEYFLSLLEQPCP